MQIALSLNFKSFLLILVCVMANSMIYGQTQKFKIHILNNQSANLLNSYEEIETVKDSFQFVDLLQSDIVDLWSRGYALAAIDTIYAIDSTVIADVFIGESYVFGQVKIDPNDLAIIQAAGLKSVRWKDKVLSLDLIDSYAETLLTYLENNGYPFASIRLDSTSISGSTINSKLAVDRNRYVPFDSLSIIGDVDLRQGFITQYLDISKDAPYSREKINNIQKRIGDLTFVELDSTPIIKFANNVAQVQLYVKPKKASRFDFLIGVLPSNANGERRVSVIGEFTGEMYNKLGQGEYIFANVQSRPETRVLDVRFKYPYLLNLPLGVDMKGSIFFNEVFRETVLDAGILYQFDGGASLKASWNNKTSRIIDVDTSAILLSKRLPNQLDIAYNAGGLEYAIQKLDYRFNPTRGWRLRLGATLGVKRIIRNSTIEELSRPELDFNLAYDTLQTNTLQTEVHLSGAYFIPAFNIATVKLGMEGGLQYNEERIFDNEFFRIGGNALLRGFDELSVLTSAYLVSTAEFRLLLDRNSYLSFPFIDYGLTRISIDDEERWDTAVSFGMGINFSTPAGIFNVSFAAGRRLDNPLDFGNTKIHFGYVSLF